MIQTAAMCDPRKDPAGPLSGAPGNNIDADWYQKCGLSHLASTCPPILSRTLTFDNVNNRWVGRTRLLDDEEADLEQYFLEPGAQMWRMIDNYLEKYGVVQEPRAPAQLRDLQIKKCARRW